MYAPLGLLLAILMTAAPLFGLRFISEPEDLVAAHFTPVWWHCGAADQHSVTYSWKFAGVDLATNSNHTIYSNGTLFIAKLANADVGTYSCTAISGGQSITSEEVTLHLAYIAATFTMHPEGQSVFLGDSITLQCHIESLPEAEISWTLDGSTIFMATVTKETRGASTLTISPVMYRNAGVYKCLGRNTLLDVTRFSNSAELIVEGPPIFRQTLQPLFVPISFTATFDCRFHGNPSPTVTWFVHTLMENGIVISTEIVSSDKYRVYDNGTFVVYDVTVGDEAFYTCRVDNMYGEMSESALLTVTGNASSPEFTAVPENVTVTEGRNVTLTCMATGNPTPHVRWEKMETTLSSDHVTQTSDGKLIMTSIQRDDSGYVTCVWDNEVGTINNTVYIDVQYAPIFTVKPQAVSVLQGTSVSLMCSATGNPQPNIAWESPTAETYISPSVSGGIVVTDSGTLTIRSVALKHQGQFMCTATNDVASSSVTAYVSVEVPPKFMLLPLSQAVLVHERVMFHCQASGSPPPSMSWLRDREGEIPSTPDRQIYLNNSLVIPAAQLRYAGVYRCFAENTRGRIESIAALTVLVPPRFIVKPRNQTSRVGNTVSIHCVTDGDPVPSQRWKKDGRTFQLDSNMKLLPNYTLTISEIRDDQFGVYECVATSQAGTISASASLEMDDLPVITTHPQNTTVNETATLILYCHGDADETPSVVWCRVTSGEAAVMDTNLARVTVTEGSLTLQNVSQSDEGSYRCVVQNSVGDLSAEAFVNVQIPPTITHTNSPQNTASQSAVTLTCQSSGDPTPSLDWINPHGHVIGGSSTYIVTDHSLLIVSANESTDGGAWTCRVCNVLGCYEELILLNVEGMPVIIGFHGHQTDTAITLECLATGYPVPTVTFISEGRIVTSVLEGHSVVGNTMRVQKEAKRREYTCRARNRYGAVETMATVPGVVSIQGIISINSREVTLTWTAPQDLGGLPLIGYRMEFISDPWSPWQQNGQILTGNEGIVGGLIPYTYYQFRVAAANILGIGRFSEPSVTVKTLPDAPSRPTDLLVMKTGDSAILLAWQHPEFINGKIDDIEYRYLLQSINAYNIDDAHDIKASGAENITSGRHSNETLEVVIEGVTDYLLYRVTVWAVNVALNKSSEPVWQNVDFTVEAPYVSSSSPERLLSIVFGILGGIAAILIVVFVVSHVRQNKRTKSLSLIKARPSLDQFYMENPKNLYDKKAKTSVKRLSGHNFYKFENDESFHSNSYLCDENGRSPNGKKSEPDVLLMAKNPLFEGGENQSLQSPSSRANSPFRTADDWRHSCELSELEIPESRIHTRQQTSGNAVAGNDVIDTVHHGTNGHVTAQSDHRLLNDALDLYSSSKSRSSENPKSDQSNRPMNGEGQSHSPRMSGKTSNSISHRSKPVRVNSLEHLKGKPPKKLTNNHENGISLHTHNHTKEKHPTVNISLPVCHTDRSKTVTFSQPEYSRESSRSGTPDSSIFTEEYLIKSVEIPESSLNDRKHRNNVVNGAEEGAELDPDWIIVSDTDSIDSFRVKAAKIKPVDLKVTYDSCGNNVAEENISAHLY